MNPKQTQALELLAAVAKKDAAALKPEHQLIADVGLDSPKQMQLLADLEDRLKLEISDEDAARINTVGDLLTFVGSK